MSVEQDELTAVFGAVMNILDPQDDGKDKWEPLPHQIPPEWRWFLWLLLAGRGSGKTAAVAKYVHDHVHGPPCLPDFPGGHRISIVAPTLGDAVTSCVYSPAGLILHDKGVKVLNRPGGLICKWSAGTEAKLFGASSPEDVERFRAGGNTCLVWCEEMAAWRYMDESWQQIRYGLRVGPWPRAVASTTPKARKLVKELVKNALGENPWVAATYATTNDNPFLDANVKRMLYEDYQGTRMGRQELLGEILEDVEGALWTGALIDMYRVHPEQNPTGFDRTVVAVDPAVSHEEDSNEHGIIVCAMNRTYRMPGLLHPDLTHGFVLDDVTCKGLPTDWGRRAIAAYHDYDANYIVAEKNNGGDMVAHVIHSLDDTIPVKLVHASKGKRKRAEPVSALYEQGRVHHQGTLPQLEDQMCTWDPLDEDPAWSPDRMDALVWGITELMVTNGRMRHNQTTDTRLRGRR